MGLSPNQMTEKIIANLPRTTGRDVNDWMHLIDTQAPRLPERELAIYLRGEYGLGAITSEILALRFHTPPGQVEMTGSELIKVQYSGAKTALLPIYEKLAHDAKAFGNDVTLDAKKTHVVLLRGGNPFADIKPATKTRIDLALRVPGAKPTRRFAESPAGAMTHKTALDKIEDIDDPLRTWLRKAYDKAKAAK